MYSHTQEEVVDPQIAKRLKQLGFDLPCLGVYELIIKGDTTPRYRDNFSSEGLWRDHNAIEPKFDDNDWHFSAPTRQAALKWFRDKHKLHVEISLGHDEDSIWYHYHISKIELGFDHDPIASSPQGFESHEEAEDEALLKMGELVI